jgi:hypothetical protein
LRKASQKNHISDKSVLLLIAKAHRTGKKKPLTQVLAAQKVVSSTKLTPSNDKGIRLGTHTTIDNGGHCIDIAIFCAPPFVLLYINIKSNPAIFNPRYQQ